MTLPKSIIVMGVEGVGKTTIGKGLARKLSYTFVDADQYHSPENIKKMSAGIPLTDADREPWLQKLNSALRDYAAKCKPVVLAASALRQKYRDVIGVGVDPTWVYLKASPDEIRERIANRHGHYAKASLLHSQLETLEEPANAITVDANKTPDEIVQEVLSKLGSS